MSTKDSVNLPQTFQKKYQGQILSYFYKFFRALSLFLKMYIPPWFEKSLKFMVFRLLENAFAVLKKRKQKFLLMPTGQYYLSHIIISQAEGNSTSPQAAFFSGIQFHLQQKGREGNYVELSIKGSHTQYSVLKLSKCSRTRAYLRRRLLLIFFFFFAFSNSKSFEVALSVRVFDSQIALYLLIYFHFTSCHMHTLPALNMHCRYFTGQQKHLKQQLSTKFY